MITFSCTNCQKEIRTTDDKAGATGKCPRCQAGIVVPQTSTIGYSQKVTCKLCGTPNDRSLIRCKSCGEPLEEKKKNKTRSNKQSVHIGDVLSESWSIFRNNIGLTIGAVVFPIAIQCILYLVGLAIFGFISPTFLKDQNLAEDEGIVILIGMYLVLLFVLGLTGIYLSAGTFFMLNNIARGRRTEMGDIFQGGRFFLRLFGNGFLIWIVQIFFQLIIAFGVTFTAEMLGFGMGNLMDFINISSLPVQLIFALTFWTLPYFIIDRDERGLKSILSCLTHVKSHWLASLVLGIISIILTIVGVAFICVGLIFTLPFCFLMYAVLFCHLTGRRTAARENRF